MPHRKQHDSRFKAQVAIEAIKNQQTMTQIASFCRLGYAV